MSQELAVQVKEVAPTEVAYLGHRGPYSEIASVLQNLLAQMLIHGWHPVGPPAVAYFNSPREAPPEELLWEVRWSIEPRPKSREATGGGPGVKRLDGRKVAATLHRGPYRELGSTYGVLMAWIAGQGYEVCGPAEEAYLNDPASTAPDELLTEIRIPVTGGPC